MIMVQPHGDNKGDMYPRDYLCGDHHRYFLLTVELDTIDYDYYDGKV